MGSSGVENQTMSPKQCATIKGSYEPSYRTSTHRKGTSSEEDWDLAPDGRVAAVTPVQSPQPAVATAEHTVVFLENFFDEMKRRVR